MAGPGNVLYLQLNMAIEESTMMVMGTAPLVSGKRTDKRASRYSALFDKSCT